MKLKEIFKVILEEEQGYLGMIDGYRLSVEGKEGSIPHIHCVKGNPKKPETVSCISLIRKGYANHTSWQVELLKKIFEDICIFLGNENASKTDKNSWLKAVEDWNESNTFKIPKNFVNPYNNEIIYK